MGQDLYLRLNHELLYRIVTRFGYKAYNRSVGKATESPTTLNSSSHFLITFLQLIPLVFTVQDSKPHVCKSGGRNLRNCYK